MKAISIRQPWAWLILNARKDVESRDWIYPCRHRGPLLIHASKTCTRREYESAVLFCRALDANTKTQAEYAQVFENWIELT